MGCTTSTEAHGLPGATASLDWTALASSNGTIRFEERKGHFAVLGAETKPTNEVMRNVVSWFPSGEIKALVFVAHGLGEHSLCYWELATKLVACGYGVYAIDHYGHGLSGGDRGIMPDTETMSQDFASYVTVIRRLHPLHLPIFVVGHSMGTLVSLHALVGKKLQDIVSAVVLSGAALVPGPAAGSPFGIETLYPIGKSSVGKGLASCMASADPNGIVAPLVLEEITSNAEKLALMARDTRRCPPVVRNKTAAEMLTLVEIVRKELPSLNIPLLALHGALDKVALPLGSQTVHSLAGSVKKELVILPGLRHEIFNEVAPHADQSMDRVVKFLEQQFEVAMSRSLAKDALKTIQGLKVEVEIDELVLSSPMTNGSNSCFDVSPRVLSSRAFRASTKLTLSSEPLQSSETVVEEETNESK